VRRATVALAMLVAVAAAMPPRQLRVEGLSMLPGLAPGAVVSIGWRERGWALAGLDRHRRWVFRAPDGALAVKRLVGLPGERVAIDDGDLVVDGLRLPAAPPLLRATASAVAATLSGSGDTVTISATDTVYDDCPEAVSERRLLQPASDGGAWALVAAGPAGPPRRVTVALGARIVTWRLERLDAALLVAGRLDGRFVAVAWPATNAPPAADGSRVPWPPGMPAGWQVELPWSVATATPFAAEVRCPGATVVAGGLWRDVVHRPAADGRREWVLGPREVFLLGDAPAVSHDCRHYGAIDRGRLLAPLAID